MNIWITDNNYEYECYSNGARTGWCRHKGGLPNGKRTEWHVITHAERTPTPVV